MRISYNWLRSLLPELNHTPAEIAAALTLRSFATTLVGQIHIDPRVIAVKIMQLEPHPNAARLQLATVTDGRQAIRVVCGAPNIATGAMVPYAPPGAEVRHVDGQPRPLAKVAIRGVPSAGMLASPRELSLGEMHSGIYLLPPNTPIGSRLNEHFPDDVILAADITPNRAHDAASHLGIARELSAIYKLAVQEPQIPPLPSSPLPDGWSLKIQAAEDVRRYIGVLLERVHVAASPLWLQARLWAAGGHPINNVVDITNYVMYELGIPTHAFDAAKLPGHTIGVRRAHPQERLCTLDGAIQQLTAADPLIVSNDQPIAIAGIIGGANSEIGDNTLALWLEIASFKPYTIQDTSRRLRLITDAAARHMKDLSSALTREAAARAVHLLQELTGAALRGLIDYYPQPVKRSPILFRPAQVNRRTGSAVPAQQCRDILTRLRCAVPDDGAAWSVTPPAERLDLTGEHDLIEEVVRLYGLERIPTIPPLTGQISPLSDRQQWPEVVRDMLVTAGGSELYNYSFEDETALALLGWKIPPAQRVRVANPPSPEQQYLRTSLIPRLVSCALANKAQLARPASEPERLLFEMNTVFSYGREPGAMIKEAQHIAFVLPGQYASKTEAGRLRDALLERFGLSSAPPNLAAIHTFGPSTAAGRKLGLPLVAVEIVLDWLIAHAERPPEYTLTSENNAVQYEPLSKYPPSYRDLSLFVSPATAAAAVQEIIVRTSGNLVARVDLFDEYAPPVRRGKTPARSLAFHLTYQSPDRTLTDEEINTVHDRIVAALKSELGAEPR
ncbi:MAG: phenylalanine--tRNA ligase subunit beta [Candidatus Andersenbacteria bacterium]|nr:phenylalanine--tRNA ligase subunit beta [Candidatus Andersenbacteria bacterium]